MKNTSLKQKEQLGKLFLSGNLTRQEFAKGLINWASEFGTDASVSINVVRGKINSRFCRVNLTCCLNNARLSLSNVLLIGDPK